MKTLTSISEHSDYLEKKYIFDNEKWHLHRKRVLFGKRQPQLSDFVACGEDGLPIKPYIKTEAEIFADDNSHCRVISKEEIAYQKALDKVLFKGWKVENKSKVTTWIESDKNESICFTDRGKVNYNGIDITSLESLTPYNLELTENANKIIGV